MNQVAPWVLSNGGCASRESLRSSEGSWVSEVGDPPPSSPIPRSSTRVFFRDPRHPLHVQPCGNPLRSLFALSVPVLVLPSDPLSPGPRVFLHPSPVSLSPPLTSRARSTTRVDWPRLLLRLAIFAAVEYGWATYPSTNLSSGALFAGNAVLLVGVWLGDAEGRLGRSQGDGGKKSK